LKEGPLFLVLARTAGCTFPPHTLTEEEEEEEEEMQTCCLGKMVVAFLRFPYLKAVLWDIWIPPPPPPPPPLSVFSASPLPPVISSNSRKV